MRSLSTLLYWGLLLALLGRCQAEAPPSPSDSAPSVTSRSIKLIEDTLDGVPIVLMGSRGRSLVVAFERQFRGEALQLTPLQRGFPVLAEDQYGNRWDAFGIARSGPDAGARLSPVNAGMGFWFVFAATYPGIDLYGGPEIEVQAPAGGSADWAVPTPAVAQGSGFDAIAALEDPAFESLTSSPQEAAAPGPDDLILAVSMGGQTKVYPHNILNWHEIVNDRVGGVPITVTYCPLTATGKVWRRPDDGDRYRFGVSGLLYNSNLLAFDRATESIWTQLDATCVFGPRRSERLELVPFVETTWREWSRAHSSSLVLSTNTGITRDYGQYPYGDYRSNQLVSYPLRYRDDRLPLKEWVFAVILPGAQRVYRLEAF